MNEALDKMTQEIVNLRSSGEVGASLVNKILTTLSPYYFNEYDTIQIVRGVAAADKYLAPIANFSVFLFMGAQVMTLDSNAAINSAEAISQGAQIVTTAFASYINSNTAEMEKVLEGVNQTAKNDYGFSLTNSKGEYNLLATLVMLGFYGLFDSYVILLCLMIATTKNIKKIKYQEMKDYLKSVFVQTESNPDQEALDQNKPEQEKTNTSLTDWPFDYSLIPEEKIWKQQQRLNKRIFRGLNKVSKESKKWYNNFKRWYKCYKIIQTLPRLRAR